jgi:hypothetical protein
MPPLSADARVQRGNVDRRAVIFFKVPYGTTAVAGSVAYSQVDGAIVNYPGRAER